MIELHVFTNCVSEQMNTSVIDTTIGSFRNTFGDPKSINIWLDNNPAGKSGGNYQKLLESKFSNVAEVSSLSDGYIKAIESSSEDYLFMLEHDWTFFSQNIHHNLAEITEFMAEFSVGHLRFNKSNNIPRGPWAPSFDEFGSESLRACWVRMRSNNPHILERKHYLDLIEKEVIISKQGSKGIEERFWKFPEYPGVVYGPEGHATTIRHIDGRGANYGK